MSEQIVIPAEKPLSMAVSSHAGQVILHISEPREYVAMTGNEPVVIGAKILATAADTDPNCGNDVIELAMMLIDHVYAIRGDLKPAGGAVKHELIERHRKKLTERYAKMLNSLREKKTTDNRGLAKLLVDAAMHEVFA